MNSRDKFIFPTHAFAERSLLVTIEDPTHTPQRGNASGVSSDSERSARQTKSV